MTACAGRGDACPRGDWLLWLAGRLPGLEALVSRATAAVARLALASIPDEHPGVDELREIVRVGAEVTEVGGKSGALYDRAVLLGSVSQVLDGQARAHVAHADALDFLRSLPPACADILATDPPYSSGGMVRGDRAKSGLAAAKYGRAEQTAEIHGDTMDARSYAFWAMLREARRVLKTGAFALVFTDWRQLPTVSDAVQAAGLVWRGVTVWNKGNAMPNKGRFRQDCEFVVVTTNGPRACGPKVPEPCYPGCYDVPQDPEDRSDLEDLPAYMRLTLPRSERRAVCLPKAAA